MKINVLTNKKVSYEDLFENLDSEHNEYHFGFIYEEDSHKSFACDELESINFYDDYLIIINNEDDRFLFRYDNMEYIKVICMNRK